MYINTNLIIVTSLKTLRLHFSVLFYCKIKDLFLVICMHLVLTYKGIRLRNLVYVKNERNIRKIENLKKIKAYFLQKLQ